jgi:hypothetical protein
MVGVVAQVSERGCCLDVVAAQELGRACCLVDVLARESGLECYRVVASFRVRERREEESTFMHFRQL